MSSFFHSGDTQCDVYMTVYCSVCWVSVKGVVLSSLCLTAAPARPRTFLSTFLSIHEAPPSRVSQLLPRACVCLCVRDKSGLF